MFTLKIDTSNAAFEDKGNELAWILRKLADKLDAPDTGAQVETFPLLDSNGNSVGEARLTHKR